MKKLVRRSTWRSGDVVAYTERDGPGRPPAGPSSWTILALATVLGATFVGTLTSNGICEEHRMLVEILAGGAIFGVAAALIALWREWSSASFITFMSSLAGVAIGMIDAVHAPTRGRMIAVGFGAASLLAASIAWRIYLADLGAAMRSSDRGSQSDQVGSAEPHRAPVPGADPLSPDD